MSAVFAPSDNKTTCSSAYASTAAGMREKEIALSANVPAAPIKYVFPLAQYSA